MKYALGLILFIASFAFADGIPVPMSQQTPYNWNCDLMTRHQERSNLHLMFTGEYYSTHPQLFIAQGGVVGTYIPLDYAQALVRKDYAYLHGKSYTMESRRTLSFEFVNGGLNVKMLDHQYDMKMESTNCRAAF